MAGARNEFGVIRTRTDGRKPHLRLARRQKELGPPIPMVRRGFGGHPYSSSDAEVGERREGRIANFLRKYAEASRS